MRFDVRDKLDAQATIAKLLTEFTGVVAKERLQGEAKYSHQSKDEAAWRTAGNLLTSFTTRRV